MKKIIILLSVASLVACGHSHEKDKELGNVHSLYLKEVEKVKADYVKDRKRLIDSVRNSMIKTEPARVGFYSAAQHKLPEGTIIDFNPDDLAYKGDGPFLIVIKGSDGLQSICKINKEQWTMFHRGDKLK